MSLLREIQEAATDGQIRSADVLRKCKILAARLHNTALDRWVELELNGYPETEPLPAYRVFDPVQSEGDFVSMTRQIRMPIPLAVLPTPELRARYSKRENREGVAYFDALLANNAGGDSSHVLRAPWSPDLIARLQHKIVEGYGCVAAWQVVPTSSMVLLLDGVRNRILKFALEIEAEAPDAGEAELRGAPPIPEARVNQILNNIFGGTAIIAIGSGFTQNPQVLVTPGDFESLRRYLQGLRVAPMDVVALEAAIRSDQPATTDKDLGPRALGWLADMATKAASGAWSVGKEVGTDVLAAAIKAYVGLP